MCIYFFYLIRPYNGSTSFGYLRYLTILFSNKTRCAFFILVEFSRSLEADLTLTSAPSRQEEATTKTSVFAPLKKASGQTEGPEYDVIHEEAIHLTHFDEDGQIVSVETMNGSLLEYWV